MTTIVTRAAKGSPLTNNEVDANAVNLKATADAALPKAGGGMSGAITTNSTFDGRDVATDGTKLDGIEASADVTDATNVTAAGALMDSELTSIASVKALNQGVATGDSPTFAAVTSTGEITANGGIALGDSDAATFGDSDDLSISHIGGNTYLTNTTGSLVLRSDSFRVLNTANSEQILHGDADGAVSAYYNNALKLATTATGTTTVGTATMDGLTVENSLSGATNLFNFQNTSNTANSNSRLKISTGGTSGGDPILQLTDNASNWYVFGDQSDSFKFKIGSSVTDNKLVIDSSGNVGIGTSTMNGGLNLGNFRGTASAPSFSGTSGDGFVFDYYNDGNPYGRHGSIAAIGAGTATADMSFWTDSGSAVAKRMTIDSSGNVLMGKSGTSFGTAGIEARSGGTLWATANVTNPASFNRLGNYGPVVYINSANTPVGNIGTTTGDSGAATMYIADQGNVGIRFDQASTDDIQPCTSSGADRDNAINLGATDNRFKDLYLSGGIHLGGTGAANKLDDYEEGSWSPAIRGDGSWSAGTQGYTTRNGNYVKVGSFVYLAFDVQVNGLGTVAGNYLQIGNFPFSVDSSNLGGGNVSYYSGVSNTSGPLLLYAASTQGYLMEGAALYVALSDATASTRIIGTIMYKTAQ